MAPTPKRVLAGATSVVTTGGKAVTAIFGGVAGGLIQNPATPGDQGGLAAVEILYVDISGAAAVTNETATCTPVQPGQFFTLPAGLTNPVSVNAATSGHRFAVVILQPPPAPPTPQPGPWPLAAQPTVQKSIPSYLYWQYQDDEDCAAFVASFNSMAQSILDWFNGTPLPIYTDASITGALLDWIAQGLYGMQRPSLSSGVNRNLGPYNTTAYNTLAYNGRQVIGPTDVVATTDDIFKRILTWNFSRIDGYYFTIRWLKRRIMRFLLGQDGASPAVPDTSLVSVTFGVGNQVNVRLVTSKSALAAGPYNTTAYNTRAYNSSKITTETFPPLPNAAIFLEAAKSGALQLPFEWDFVFTMS